MLRNFHYIDDQGKDQGINGKDDPRGRHSILYLTYISLVRNRSKELAEMLQDLDRIRQERRKAKQNRTKYVGTGNDGMSFAAGGSRYGGFSSDDYNSGGGSRGGGGGGGGGGGSSGYGGSYDRGMKSTLILVDSR